ncbi:hypothetical protein CLV28_2421 [Sediminihabitans luteus]|uniref:Uncharacterized protein n=1 Tax=Sediminihabitans luteus TaxID=1138585 RepID=A0A2M9CDD3_9CELL|nr:hypothetical protein [Sediminihabitans luteus]PJJ69944.1 hypothetical protein CLV28_2421 [Sediminihabitans luteus]GII99264.1 hypothetical protein Slu03_16420 [Sediminihabitans luteus]
MSSATRSPLVTAYLRAKARVAVLLLVVGSILAVAGAVMAYDNVDSMLASYEPVQVTVTEEHTELQSRGSRRARHMEDVRVVSVTLPDGSTDSVMSDDLAVGETATVLRDSRDDRLVAVEPDGPGFGGWAAVVLMLGLGVIAIVNGVWAVRKRSRVKNADLDSAPVLTLQVTAMAAEKVEGKPGQKLTVTVLSSTTKDVKPGQTLEIKARAALMPGQVAAQLDARVLSGNEVSSLLALGTGASDPQRWIGEATNPSALESLAA